MLILQIPVVVVVVSKHTYILRAIYMLEEKG